LIRRTLISALILLLCVACGSQDGSFHPPTKEVHLQSGKVIRVTSCFLAWGADHDQRLASQDAFALEYVSPALASAPEELDREAREAFELIRPISEQWGFVSASVSAFPTAERTGKYEVFLFFRSSQGSWSYTRHSEKVFNTESGRKD